MYLTKSLIFVLTLLCTSTNAQEVDYFDYYKKINTAELLYANQEYAKADSLYQLSFKAVPRPHNQDLFLASANAISYKKYDQASEYLKQGFSLGLTYKQVKNHSFYPSLKSAIKVSKLKREYKTRHRTYQAQLDPNLKSEMAMLVKRDQEPRTKKYDRLPWKEQQQFMKLADSLNFEIIKSYCEQGTFLGIGNIGENNIGKFAVEDISLLMRHMSREHLETLKPYFLEAIRQGELYPWQYASAYDHINMYKTTIEDRDENGRPILIIQQTYGTFYFTNDKREFEIYAVENMKTGNQLRKEIGLDSMEEYANKEGLKLPKEGEFKKIF